MTTIAWDGKSLAGDSFANRGGLKHHVDAKVWRLSDGCLYGGCGDFADVLAVRDYLKCLVLGSSNPNVPNSWPSGLQDYSGLFISPDSRCKVLCERQPGHDAPFPFFAIGSGRDFAIAAMHLGKSAREAVELAAEYDCYTGGPIIELALNP